ncbi:ATP-binding protein [Streptomyces sp. NA02950]|uniref:ATP-binding protein n=1 Tax=Streptomyces sp. NA02950 TaxID=2742137 RepID=UPI0015921753|nr:ATP-binding protein [Streptomyces sp. NA02950]QKV95259.1 ATP-binding protein [Streptomyces sp. NA02950]
MTPATAVAPVAARRLPQTSRTFDVAFTPDPVRVGHMRRITKAFLRKWNVRGPLAENIVLVVSELVTNAVEHGKGDAQLRVRHLDEEVRIEVTDSSSIPAQMRPASDEAESGRGLILTSVLARKWGVSDDGRTTWARFRVPAGRS